jgi:hypothetical protein
MKVSVQYPLLHDGEVLAGTEIDSIVVSRRRFSSPWTPRRWEKVATAVACQRQRRKNSVTCQEANIADAITVTYLDSNGEERDESFMVVNLNLMFQGYTFNVYFDGYLPALSLAGMHAAL